jgi:hypothetical protein
MIPCYHSMGLSNEILGLSFQMLLNSPFKAPT